MRPISEIREDFPILQTSVHGRPLVYLDNGATMQVPVQIMNAVSEQYTKYNANIHRGVHYLSELSTSRVENVRIKIAGFIGAEDPCEIIFTSGTTQGINMAAASMENTFIRKGDLIVTTEMEHHSNLIPWQELCRRTGARLGIIHVRPDGELDQDEFEELLEYEPKLLALTCVSNVLGTVNPVKEIIEHAHAAGALVLLDAAQAMRHSRIDVRELGCDFLCFSGHKIMAPAGTGVFYGKKECLEKLRPAAFGGGMVDEVDLQSASYAELPFRFEAGTQNIAGIIGLGAAIDYLESEDVDEIASYEQHLLKYAETKLKEIPAVRILGNPKKRAGTLSFYIDGIHSYDIAKLLDAQGVAVRSGHHCAEPLLKAFGLENVVRITPAFYNYKEEIEYAAACIERILKLLR